MQFHKNAYIVIYNVSEKISLYVEYLIWDQDIKIYSVSLYCVKSVQIRSFFSGPYFPKFGLNTERYRASLRIPSKYGKTRARKNSVFGHFSHSVIIRKIVKRTFKFLEQVFNLCLTILWMLLIIKLTRWTAKFCIEPYSVVWTIISNSYTNYKTDIIFILDNTSFLLFFPLLSFLECVFPLFRN